MRATFCLGLLIAGCATGATTEPRGGDRDASLDALVPALDARTPEVDAALAPADAALDARGEAPDGSAECPSGQVRCGDACVDTRTDLAHCGGCGRACDVAFGSESCVGGTCFVAACDPGHADCNTMASDGCETSCAAGEACTTSCGTTGARACASICAPTCTPPAEVCNLRDDDCDGACELGLPGCRIGVHRARRNAGGHFYTNDRAEVAPPAYTPETFDYFHLYAASQPGLAALHRCRLASGFFFYTLDPGCEGSPGAANQGALGWLATTPICGSTPLYRLYGSTSGHLFTTAAGERDALVSGGAYIFEGVVGHVWPAP